MFDIIIIGAGPAGISSALYAKRANTNIAIIYNQGGSLVKTESIENYYGLPQPISGTELLENGLTQAKALDIPLIKQEVLSIEYNGIFTVKTKSDSYETKSVILATGTSRLAPNIIGIREFEGKGVSYCAMCDAFFYRNKNVAVLGSGEYAAHEAAELLPIVGSVTIVTNGEPLSVPLPEGVKLNTNKITSISGTNRVNGVHFEDGSNTLVDGVFVAVGVVGSGQLARIIGAEQVDNKIKIDENMQTSVNGLFACGDCVGGLLQIVKAVHQGAVAGIEAVKFLRKVKSK